MVEVRGVALQEQLGPEAGVEGVVAVVRGVAIAARDLCERALLLRHANGVLEREGCLRLGMEKRGEQERREQW